jgi:GNAT superfamily N-acetyltransferase
MTGLDIHPLTPDRWDDLATLFGPNGANSGCWCMWWRTAAAEWDEQAGDRLRDRFREVVAAGPPPGLLAYRAGVPVGWVAVGPREEYGRLNRSPKLKPVDDRPVWAVVCFFVAAAHRRSGVAAALLEAAASYAREHGAQLLEGYPIDTGDRRRESGAVFTGTLDLFTEAGFTEVLRRGGRPIVRRAP